MTKSSSTFALPKLNKNHNKDQLLIFFNELISYCETLLKANVGTSKSNASLVLPTLNARMSEFYNQFNLACHRAIELDMSIANIISDLVTVIAKSSQIIIICDFVDRFDFASIDLYNLISQRIGEHSTTDVATKYLNHIAPKSIDNLNLSDLVERMASGFIVSKNFSELDAFFAAMQECGLIHDSLFSNIAFTLANTKEVEETYRFLQKVKASYPAYMTTTLSHMFLGFVKDNNKVEASKVFALLISSAPNKIEQSIRNILTYYLKIQFIDGIYLLIQLVATQSPPQLEKIFISIAANFDQGPRGLPQENLIVFCLALIDDVKTRQRLAQVFIPATEALPADYYLSLANQFNRELRIGNISIPTLERAITLVDELQELLTQLSEGDKPAQDQLYLSYVNTFKLLTDFTLGYQGALFAKCDKLIAAIGTKRSDLQIKIILLFLNSALKNPQDDRTAEQIILIEAATKLYKNVSNAAVDNKLDTIVTFLIKVQNGDFSSLADFKRYFVGFLNAIKLHFYYSKMVTGILRLIAHLPIQRFIPAEEVATDFINQLIAAILTVHDAIKMGETSSNPKLIDIPVIHQLVVFLDDIIKTQSENPQTQHAASAAAPKIKKVTLPAPESAKNFNIDDPQSLLSLCQSRLTSLLNDDPKHQKYNSLVSKITGFKPKDATKAKFTKMVQKLGPLDAIKLLDKKYQELYQRLQAVSHTDIKKLQALLSDINATLSIRDKTDEKLKIITTLIKSNGKVSTVQTAPQLEAAALPAPIPQAVEPILVPAATLVQPAAASAPTRPTPVMRSIRPSSSALRLNFQASASSIPARGLAAAPGLFTSPIPKDRDRLTHVKTAGLFSRTPLTLGDYIPASVLASTVAASSSLPGRIGTPYSANLTSSLSRTSFSETVNIQSLCESDAQAISEHAGARVDLFFCLLIIYHKQNVMPIVGKTQMQHGKGSAGSSSSRGTQAAHRSLFSSFTDTHYIKLIEGTHFAHELNATDEMPPFANQFDNIIEMDRPTYLRILERVSYGEITPIDGMQAFLIQMKETLQSDLTKKTFINRYGHEEIYEELVLNNKMGSLKDRLLNNNEVSPHYIDHVLRITPEERKGISGLTEMDLYLRKIQHLQQEFMTIKNDDSSKSFKK